MYQENFYEDMVKFGEALRIVQDKLDSRNFYAFNPGFDVNASK